MYFFVWISPNDVNFDWFSSLFFCMNQELVELVSSRSKTATGTTTASSAPAARPRWLARASSLMELTSCALNVQNSESCKKKKKKKKKNKRKQIMMNREIKKRRQKCLKQQPWANLWRRRGQKGCGFGVGGFFESSEEKIALFSIFAGDG